MNALVITRSLLFFLLCAAHFLVPGQATAQLLQNITVGSAKALSLANAVTADPMGIDSIHFNPAGLHKVKDRQSQIKLIAGQFSIEGSMQRSERYLDDLAQAGYQYDDDPVVEGSSVTSDVSVMLPIFGLTDLPALVAPAGGMSLELYPYDAVIGSSVFAPMIVGFNRGDDSSLRYQGNKLGMTHLTYFSPTIAFPFTDTVTVGVGLHLNYTGIGIDTDLRLLNPVLALVDDIADMLCNSTSLAGAVNVCEGDLGPFTDIGNLQLEVEDFVNPSFNLGLLWEPTPWFSWGLTYQSGAKSLLKGQYSMDYGDEWLAFMAGINSDALGPLLNQWVDLPKGVASESGAVSMEFSVPEHIAMGISIGVFPDLKVNMDAKWTDTSAWKEFRLEFSDAPDFLPMLSLLDPERATDTALVVPRNYESTLTWAVGVEYQYNDRLALRAGYEDRGNAIPSERMDFLAPFGEAYLIGAGFSLIMSTDAMLDVGVGFLSSSNSAVDNESFNANNRDQIIYNPYGGSNLTANVDAYLFEVGYQTRF